MAPLYHQLLVCKQAPVHHYPSCPSIHKDVSDIHPIHLTFDHCCRALIHFLHWDPWQWFWGCCPCRELDFEGHLETMCPCGDSCSTSVPPVPLSMLGFLALRLDHSSGSPLPNGLPDHSSDTAATIPCLAILQPVVDYLEPGPVRNRQQVGPPLPQSTVSTHSPAFSLALEESWASVPLLQPLALPQWTASFIHFHSRSITHVTCFV